MCGRLPVGKGCLDVLSFGRCGHVCGLLMRHTKAAGHNAFRGDGSRSKARARSALAQMGFPVLGFDRWCITSRLPFPNSARCCWLNRSHYRFSISLPGHHHGPDHPGHLAGQRDRRDLGRPAGEQMHQPGSLRSMPLSVTDDSQGPDHKQLPQISIALLCDAAQLLLAAAGVLPRYKADPGSQSSARLEGCGVRHGSDHSAGQHRADAGHFHQAAAQFCGPSARPDPTVILQDLAIDQIELADQRRQ
jgi:hypothetical protein